LGLVESVALGVKGVRNRVVVRGCLLLINNGLSSSNVQLKLSGHVVLIKHLRSSSSMPMLMSTITCYALRLLLLGKCNKAMSIYCKKDDITVI